MKLIVKKDVFLEGIQAVQNVIDVRSPYEGSGVLGVINKGFFAWIFVFMILGLFIFISIKKVAKRKSVLFFDGSLPKKKEGDRHAEE